ncbi:hypothetical protein CH063_02913 [Colletotrichum higginsianum]|uniref:Uncharacterized protein n=1 Tax=Colletotrichum higginsianum (strain IMI 349063) TaxID=759273 RepID=H1VR86_COLHI|nr:hypothetical protein CH063_02913 [Colletotrichum higginsianum]
MAAKRDHHMVEMEDGAHDGEHVGGICPEIDNGLIRNIFKNECLQWQRILRAPREGREGICKNHRSGIATVADKLER